MIRSVALETSFQGKKIYIIRALTQLNEECVNYYKFLDTHLQCLWENNINDYLQDNLTLSNVVQSTRKSSFIDGGLGVPSWAKTMEGHVQEL